MSELTTCNFCNLRRYKADAKARGLKVTLLPSDFMGGTDCFIHPKDVKIRKLSEEEKKQYFRSWFMEISDRCCC